MDYVADSYELSYHAKIKKIIFFHEKRGLVPYLHRLPSIAIDFHQYLAAYIGIPRISEYRFTQSCRSPETTDPERTMAEERDVKFIIKCVVKCYHACHYSVEDGEAFVARRKRGECGNASRMNK